MAVAVCQVAIGDDYASVVDRQTRTEALMLERSRSVDELHRRISRRVQLVRFGLLDNVLRRRMPIVKRRRNALLSQRHGGVSILTVSM